MAWSCLVCHHCYFNSRPSARGDATAAGQDTSGILFQFTPLREGRLVDVLRQRQAFDFNSRPSARGDGLLYRVEALERKISIHAPPRGATYAIDGGIGADGHFNSRPSARGDVKFEAHYHVTSVISIHAPPRGATLAADMASFYNLISIHAPPRGATHPRGVYVLGIGISIHAPPRGATIQQRARRAGICISIHAPPRGATWRGAPGIARENFNSRPSARGDAGAALLASRGKISIHAPPRGATWVVAGNFADMVFQFTPLREGRRQKICNFCKSFVQPLQISMA